MWGEKKEHQELTLNLPVRTTGAVSHSYFFARPLVSLISEVAHELEVSAATLHAAAAAAAALLPASAVARGGQLRVAAEAAGGGGAGLARELEAAVEADVRAQ